MLTLALAAVVLWLILMLASLNFGGWTHLLLVIPLVSLAVAARKRLARRHRYTPEEEARG